MAKCTSRKCPTSSSKSCICHGSIPLRYPLFEPLLRQRRGANRWTAARPCMRAHRADSAAWPFKILAHPFSRVQSFSIACEDGATRIQTTFGANTDTLLFVNRTTRLVSWLERVERPVVVDIGAESTSHRWDIQRTDHPTTTAAASSASTRANTRSPLHLRWAWRAGHSKVYEQSTPPKWGLERLIRRDADSILDLWITNGKPSSFACLSRRTRTHSGPIPAPSLQ